MKGTTKKIIILGLLIALCLCAITPAFAAADPEQIRTEVTKTALVIVLITCCVVAIVFVIKQQFAALFGFLGIAVIVVVLVGTKGEILVVFANWVSSWFGTSIQ